MEAEIIKKKRIRPYKNKHPATFLDPRQSRFLALYTDPSSETFGNALQTAQQAGYSKEYAEVITGQMPDWLSENLRSSQMLQKAEKRLSQFMEYEPDSSNPAFSKIVQDTSKFVAERLGKQRYSLKIETENKSININMDL